MKILFLYRWVGAHLGGTETHIKNLMDFFVFRDHEAYLIIREGQSDYMSGNRKEHYQQLDLF